MAAPTTSNGEHGDAGDADLCAIMAARRTPKGKIRVHVGHAHRMDGRSTVRPLLTGCRLFRGRERFDGYASDCMANAIALMCSRAQSTEATQPFGSTNLCGIQKSEITGHRRSAASTTGGKPKSLTKVSRAESGPVFLRVSGVRECACGDAEEEGKEALVRRFGEQSEPEVESAHNKHDDEDFRQPEFHWFTSMCRSTGVGQ